MRAHVCVYKKVHVFSPIATLVHPPRGRRRSDSAASDLFYHVTNTDTCRKAHAHTRPYRKCIISIDFTVAIDVTVTKHVTSLQQNTVLISVHIQSLAHSVFTDFHAHALLHLSPVTGLFYAPSLTCYRPVLRSIPHLLQASSTLRL
jgi:hypothetical protein